jgi:hypothetical protein
MRLKVVKKLTTLQADLISNMETIGTAFRTKNPGNGAAAFHDDGRVCAVGGWDGRCVRLTPLMFFMVDLSANDRVSSLSKKMLLLSINKHRC